MTYNVPANVRIIRVHNTNSTNNTKETVMNQTPVVMKQAIEASKSSRLINWLGNTTLAAAQATAPVVGKVEVMAVPVAARTAAKGLDYTAKSTNWLGNKLATAAAASSAFAQKHTPADAVKSIESSKEEMVTLEMNGAKVTMTLSAFLKMQQGL